MQEPIVFQTYASIEQATEVADQLRGRGIAATVVKVGPRLDSAIIGPDYGDKYAVKIMGSDFTEANKILYSDSNVDLDSVDVNHPLMLMNNEELKGIIAKPDEWGAENYSIALALLKSRGVTISETVIDSLKEERIAILSRRKKLSPYFLLTGYSSAILPCLFNALKYHQKVGGYVTDFIIYLPGFLGLFIGWVILRSRTTLPDGRQIPSFEEGTIKHGIAIVILNVLSWIISLLFGLFILA